MYMKLEKVQEVALVLVVLVVVVTDDVAVINES